MIQIKPDSVNQFTNIKEGLHSLLMEIIEKNDFESIYQKAFINEGEIDEIVYFGPREGEYVKGYLLKRFDIISTSSETEYLDVKKDVFIMENGEMVLFNHVEEYTEQSDTYYTILYRELSADQTFTAKEFASLIDTIKTELNV